MRRAAVHRLVVTAAITTTLFAGALPATAAPASDNPGIARAAEVTDHGVASQGWSWLRSVDDGVGTAGWSWLR